MSTSKFLKKQPVQVLREKIESADKLLATLDDIAQSKGKTSAQVFAGSYPIPHAFIELECARCCIA